MSRAEVETTTTLEENFMFGSPPLLKGFAYSSCRAQESHSHASTYELDSDTNNSVSVTEVSMFGRQINSQRLPYALRKNQDENTIQNQFSSLKYDNRENDNPQQQSFSKPNSFLFSKGIPHNHNLPSDISFVKRKDLRNLRNVLSKERFRQVVMKFGSFDDEGQEILDSVHQTMKAVNSTKVKCLFCPNLSSVYENFPVVDGTLFLSPIRLSKDCIPYQECGTKRDNSRFMCFVCVHCMDGKPEHISCGSCGCHWNGSFFQIGTLYAYNIISAIPCCQRRVSCSVSGCRKPILSIDNGEASTLYFSHFSKKISCPHCSNEDYHYVKSLSESLQCIKICT